MLVPAYVLDLLICPYILISDHGLEIVTRFLDEFFYHATNKVEADTIGSYDFSKTLCIMFPTRKKVNINISQLWYMLSDE
jgi:hypothetical protein